mmetsp:Transcript_19912/g.29530  ORF Transcript_19912/g.29530 Transcript_19912/m.29530 type:complete len:480 (-) Transcript_19912:67-1506(-)
MNNIRWLLLLAFVVATTIFLTDNRKKSVLRRRRLGFFDPKSVESKRSNIAQGRALLDRRNMMMLSRDLHTTPVNRIMMGPMMGPWMEQHAQQQQQPVAEVEPIMLSTEREIYQHIGKYETAFCVPWSLNTVDEWWTYHPEWEVYLEKDDSYCFRLIPSEEKRLFFRNLHQHQFPTDQKTHCQNVLSHPTTNSGWGADLDWYGSGLRDGMATNRPFQLLANNPWHYAAPSQAGKHNEGQPNMRAVCPAKDLTCYFLPLSHCPKVKINKKSKNNASQVTYSRNDIVGPGRWYYDWIVRQRSWLRRQVYDLTKKQLPNIKTPCTVIHARRGDTILAKGQRSYHSIAEYLNSADGRRGVERNILLLTDDANAIQEAKTEFPSPQYNWMYVDRPRYEGNAGGWENHLPSNDAAQEVIAMLTELQLAQRCTSLIRGHSTFADVLEGYIRSAAADDEDVAVYHLLDKGGTDNQATLNISAFYSKTQ